MKIELDKVRLVEKCQKDFSKKINVSQLSNTDRLDTIQFKYLFIEDNENFLGYIILKEAFNKSQNRKYWILLNIEIHSNYKGCNVGSVALEKVHHIFSSELGVNSYIVTLNSYIMYKMIARECIKGNVDFYCLINTDYPVEEMKEEEKYLEQALLQNPNLHADMIVSFNKEGTERAKLEYFKQL